MRRVMGVAAERHKLEGEVSAARLVHSKGLDKSHNDLDEVFACTACARPCPPSLLRPSLALARSLSLSLSLSAFLHMHANVYAHAPVRS